MSDFTSVAINGNRVQASTKSSANIPDAPSKGVLNDLAATQPKSMRVTTGPDGMNTENIKTNRVQAPKVSGLPGSLSTIQDIYGRPVGDMSAINPKADTIQVGRSRCSIETAMQQGLLYRDAAGNLVETDALKGVNSKHLNQGEGKKETVDLVEGHRDTLSRFHQRVGMVQTNAFITQMINAAVTGKGVDYLVSSFSQSVGAKEDSVHAWATEYINDLMDNGLREASRLGDIDMEKLTQFVGTLPADVQGRLLAAVHHGDPSALKYLITIYRQGYNR